MPFRPLLLLSYQSILAAAAADIEALGASSGVMLAFMQPATSSGDGDGDGVGDGGGGGGGANLSLAEKREKAEAAAKRINEMSAEEIRADPSVLNDLEFNELYWQ